MILTGLAVVVGAVALVALLVKIWSVSQIKKFYRVKGKGDKYMGSAGVTGMLKMLLPYPGKTKLSNSQRQMQEYLKNGRKDGVMHSFFGPFNAIVVADPEVIKYIIMNPKKFPKQTIGFQGTQVGDFLGNSIVFTEGEEWKAQRHVINPAFYDIELFYKPFGELIDKCLAKWAVEVKKNGGKAAINIPTDMTNMTIDILGRTVFGHDFGALEGKLDDYVESYMFLMSSLNNPIRMFVKFLGKLPTQYNKDMKYHLKRFDDMINKLIEDRRVKLAQDVEKKELEKTLLDLMIESQDTNNTLTNQQLRDNMVVFFVAGHETTASALGFVFYNLGKHLRVQEKLVEEIQNTCGLDTAPTYDQLNAMEYLNDVIKESMRLYSPTGGVTPKAAAEDCELGGYHVPKGTLISLSLWCAHHAEENYGSDVMEFRPERWQGEEGKKIHKFANIPFSAGSRVCIGNNFSLVEQRLFIVKLLQRYSVALTPGYKFRLEPGSTLHHMESDFEIILKQRQ